MGKKTVDSRESTEPNKLFFSDAEELVTKELPNIKNMQPQEIRKFYEDHKNDYTMFESSIKDDILDRLSETHSELLENDKRTVESKKNLREEACKNLWRSYLVINLLQNKFSLVDRTEAALLDYSLSDAAFEKNQFYFETMTNGTQEDKKRAVEQKLASLKSIDFEKFDFSDDKNFAKNLHAFNKLKLQCDIENINEIADRYEIDFSEKRFENYCKTSNACQSVMLSFSNKVAIITNPFYENIKFGAINSHEISESLYNDNELTNDSLLEQAIGSINNNYFHAPNSPFISGAITLQNPSVSIAEKREQVLSVPEEFNLSGKFEVAENIRNTELSNATHDKLIEMASEGKLLKDTENGFFKEAVDSSRADLLPKNVTTVTNLEKEKVAKMITAFNMQKEYTKDILNNVSVDEINRKYNEETLAKQSEELAASTVFNSFGLNHIDLKSVKELKFGYDDTLPKLASSFEAFKLEREQLKERDEKLYYKTLLEENIKTIKECDDTFSVKEEDKDKICSDERIALNRKAKAFLKQVENTSKFFNENNPGGIPKMFARCMPYLLEYGDTDEVKQKNLKFISDITDQTLTGDIKRKETLLNTLNDINTIQYIDYSALDTDSKRLDMCIQQYKKCRLAFICKGDLQQTDGCGFKLSDDAYARFSKNSQTLQNISTETMAFIKMVAADTFLTMPTEQMSEHYKDNTEKLQLSMLQVQKKETNSACMNTMFTVNELLEGKKEAQAVKDKPMSRNTFSLNDFRETQPASSKFCNDMTDVRKAFLRSYKTLKDADHFYNLKNSKEYTSLLRSLERAEFVFARQKELIDDKNGPQVYKTVCDVLEKADKYMNKYANTEMNKTRKTRFDACSELSSYLSKLVAPNSNKNPDREYQRDNRFTAFIKTANDTAIQKKNGTYTQKRINKLLDFADTRTESLEKLKKSFAENTTEKIAVTDLKLARAELASSAKQNDLNPERRAFLLSTVFCCTPLSKENATPVGLTANKMTEIIKKTAENPDFRKFADTFDKEKIAKLLSGYSEKTFNDSCKKILQTEKKPVEKISAVSKDEPILNI